MAITYVDSTIGVETSSNTSVTVAKPTGLTNGDVMYAILCERGNADWNTLAGWTDLGESGSSTEDDRRIAVQRKVVTDAAGEPANYTFTHAASLQRNIGMIVALRGADNTTPEDATTVLSDGLNDFTPDSPSITTVTANAWIIVGELVTANTGVMTVVQPSGYTLRENGDAGNGLGGCGMATFQKAATGATGLINWPNTGGDAGDDWATCTIAVRPAAAGGTSIPVISNAYFMRRTDF